MRESKREREGEPRKANAAQRYGTGRSSTVNEWQARTRFLSYLKAPNPNAL